MKKGRSHSFVLNFLLAPIASPNREIAPRDLERIGYLAAACVIASVSPVVYRIIILYTLVGR